MIGQEKKIKGLQNGKEKITVSFFASNMILCVEELRYSTKKLLELIWEFRTVTGNKINTQKSITFIHAGNDRSRKNI